MTPLARVWLLVMALALLVPSAAHGQDASGFQPLSGTAGCLAAPGVELEGCGRTPGLLGARDVAVSPDGTDVYVAGGGRRTEVAANAVTRFRRDAATGALTAAGCVSSSGGDGRIGSDGLCADGDGLDGAIAVTVSPDGTSVYVAAQQTPGVAAFARDPQTGALTQVGCHSTYPRSGRCAYAPALDGADDVTVSPDGRNVYVTAGDHGVLATFDRDAETGALTYAGCISDTGLDGVCTDGQALEGAHGVTVTPDGAAVYVTATVGAVSTYARDAATGALTPTACLVAEAPKGASCRSLPELDGARTLVIAPSGDDVYVGVDLDSGQDDMPAIVALRRGADPTRLEPNGCYAYAAPSESDNQEEEPFEDDEDDVADDAQANGCDPVKSLFGVDALALSADGRTLIAVSPATGVAALTRDPVAGTLRQTGCAEPYGTYQSCRDDEALGAVTAVATTTDGRNAYFAGEGVLLSYGAAVAVTTSRRLASHGRARVTLRCPKARRGGCRGRLTATAAHRRTAKGAGRRAGRAYRLRAGQRRTVTVRVAGARRARKLRVAVRATDGRGLVRPTVASALLRR